MNAGIVVGGGLEHSDEHGRLLGGEGTWGGAEVGLGGGLDAKGVGAEVDGVGILGENLLLGEEVLQLVGCYPLLALHDEHLQAGNVAEQSRGVLGTGAEQVLGQLLGNGRCATGIVVQQIVLEYGQECLVVDAVVGVEALVLGVNQCLPEHGAYLVVAYWRAVLTEELSYLHFVGTEDFRCLCRAFVLDGLHGGRLAEQPQEVGIDGQQVKEECHYHRGYC